MSSMQCLVLLEPATVYSHHDLYLTLAVAGSKVGTLFCHVFAAVSSSHD